MRRVNSIWNIKNFDYQILRLMKFNQVNFSVLMNRFYFDENLKNYLDVARQLNTILKLSFKALFI